MSAPAPAPIPLAALNPAQRQAVTTTHGPLLVLAGAGSGKTRVLTARITHLVDTHGTDPRRVLAITFTRKAAAEMRGRLAQQLGTQVANQLTVTTFHALGVQMLKQWGLAGGLASKLGIADEGSGLVRVRGVLRDMGAPLNAKGERPGEIMARISQAKTLLAEELVRRTAAEPGSGEAALDLWRKGDPALWARPDVQSALGAPSAERFAAHYAGYQAWLARDGVVDYDDLLGLPLAICLARPDVRTRWPAQWEYVLVDEYQDTDIVQDRLLEILTAGHGNLCAVGDDDQAIYSWRGARVDNIRTFAARHPGCVVVALEDNYRSTPEILEAANASLTERAEAGRPQKRLRATQGASGEPVRVWQHTSQEVEAHVLVRDMQQARASGEVGSWNDVFVLYRLNGVARAVELAFKRAGVPYRITGKLALHERAEALSVLSWLRLADNPYDTASFELAAQNPPRGIGPATTELLRSRARVLGVPILDLLDHEGQLEGVRPAQVTALAEMREIVRAVVEMAARQGVAAATQGLLDETGVRERLITHMAAAEAEDDDEEAEAWERRMHDLDDFVLYVEEFVQRRPADRHSIDALLEDMVTRSHHDEAPSASTGSDAVTLMSVHSAKGLEARRVYVIGLEEGVFPVETGTGAEGEALLAEEARLFYVALTRAEHHLVLSSARTRELRRGEIRPMPFSRFLSDLPETLYRLEIYSSDTITAEQAGDL